MFQDTGSSYVKIGKANDVVKRGKTLQSTPTKLELLGVIVCDSEPAAYAIESTIHKELHVYRIGFQTEWFKYSKEVVACFEKHGGEFGEVDNPPLKPPPNQDVVSNIRLRFDVDVNTEWLDLVDWLNEKMASWVKPYGIKMLETGEWYYPQMFSGDSENSDVEFDDRKIPEDDEILIDPEAPEFAVESVNNFINVNEDLWFGWAEIKNKADITLCLFYWAPSNFKARQAFRLSMFHLDITADRWDKLNIKHVLLHREEAIERPKHERVDFIEEVFCSPSYGDTHWAAAMMGGPVVCGGSEWTPGV